MGGTIATRLDLGSNALNVLRLVLAVFVILSHSFPLAGKGPDPAWGGVSLGTLAVGGFFAISGYLIPGSRLTTGPAGFAWRRFVRIFPAYWVCLVFTAFCAAAFGGLERSGWHASDALRYVVSYLDMSDPAPLDPPTLAGAPFPGSWNGSLWSLRYEVAAYVATGLALTWGVLWRRSLVLGAWATASCVSLALHLTGHPSGTFAEIALLAPYFLAGAVLLRFADRVQLAGRWALAGALALILVGVAHEGEALCSMPLAYLLLWAGAAAPMWFRRIGSRHDLSYGTYLYAFPVQQMLVAVGLARLPVAGFAALSVAATVPMAALSWFGVERPALRAKRLVGSTRRRPPAAPPP